jgi:hypothetical protein
MALTKNSQIDLNGNEMILDADGDTTITADTDDQIDFKTAGSDRVTINSSGKVGIGTSSPEHALHVDSGTANTVAQFKSTDANAYIEFLDSNSGTSGCFIGGATDDFVVLPNASEKLRVTSAGKVGIGTSNPSAELHVKKNDAGFEVDIDSQVTDGVRLLAYDRDASTDRPMQYRASQQIFYIGSSEAMRIDSNGVNIGATTVFSGSTELEVQYGITVKHSTTIGQARNIYMDDNAGALKYYNGYNVASLSNAGSWTNASDIAYKENIVDTEHGLDVVKLLQPRDYTLKSDSSSQTGFIAQELETHLPQFVEGDEGEKGVNYGQLTAVLTKAIQEQQEQIEALQSEINTLKGG